MVAHGLPVVATFRTGTRLYPLPDLLLEDVTPIRRFAGSRIDARKHVLKDSFLVTEKLAGLPIELPQNTRFTDRKHQLPLADIYENPLKHLVEVQRFTGSVLEMPDKLAVVRIEGQRRTRVQPFVSGFRATAH